jgi:hypothetical protein
MGGAGGSNHPAGGSNHPAGPFSPRRIQLKLLNLLMFSENFRLA